MALYPFEVPALHKLQPQNLQGFPSTGLTIYGYSMFSVSDLLSTIYTEQSTNIPYSYYSDYCQHDKVCVEIITFDI